MTAGARSSTVRIRDLVRADVAAVAAIEREAFSDPWPASAFHELMVQPHARLRLAEGVRDAVPAGYCVVLRMADEAEIATIATAPGLRRTGIGHLLLADALAAADADGVTATFLEVRESNAAARALYAVHGFREVGRRPRYYRLPEEDALLLRRPRPADAS